MTLRVLAPTLLVALSLYATSCSKEQEEITAPKIHYGQDVCAECSMIVSEERFAGAIGLRSNGRVQYLMFDDIGEMLEFDPPAHEEIHWYVHNTETSEWLGAEDAFFIVARDLRTPMGTGVGAYATVAQATTAAAKYRGEVVTLESLRP